MKKLVHAILLSALVLGSCSSGKNAFLQGNYYESIITSVNRLRRNPDHDKSIETLRGAYPMALTFYDDRAKNALASTAEFKWGTVVESYLAINTMYDEIMRCPGALAVIPNPANYSAKLQEARMNAAEEQYAAGLAAMAMGIREKAKLAYGYFKRANDYVPGYKDVNRKLEEALWAATLKVVMEPIPAPAKSVGVSADFFNNKVSEYLHSNSTNQFVKFFTPQEAKSLKLNADHIIRIEFQDIEIGQVTLQEKQVQVQKDSIDAALFTTVTPQGANPVIDSQGGNTEAEKAAKEKAEKEKADKEAAAKAEADRLAKEKADKEKAEKELAEKAAKDKAEKEKADKEKADKEKADKELAEKAEKEKAEKEKAEKEKADKEKAEKEKAEKEKADKEKADKEKAEKDKAEKEKADKEKADKEKADKELAEKAEKEKADKEKAEKEKAEKEKADKEKADKEKAEKELAEKAEKEKAEKEKAEKEKAEKEKADKEKADKEKAEKELAEKAEKEKAEKEKAEKEKAEKEKADKEKADKEKAEKELAEKAEKEKAEKEKAEKEKAEKEKADKEKADKEKAEKELAEKAEKEKAEKEKAEKEKAEKEKAEKEKNEKKDGEDNEKKDDSKSGDEKKTDEKKTDKKDGGTSFLTLRNPVYYAAATAVKIYGIPADTNKVYSPVKATITYFKKTVVSKAVVTISIIDAKTNAVLSVEKVPSEHIWASEWATFNGDERALSPGQKQLCKEREKTPPAKQDLFTELSKPVFDQLTSRIQSFYKGY